MSDRDLKSAIQDAEQNEQRKVQVVFMAPGPAAPRTVLTLEPIVPLSLNDLRELRQVEQTLNRLFEGRVHVNLV